MAERKLFIGSSSEARNQSNVIDWIVSELESKVPDVEVHVWDEKSLWAFGVSTLDNLVEFTKEFFYSIFIFFPDDIINYRGVDYYITRDNVIFESGLFYSKLGKDRTFIFKPSKLINATPDKFQLHTDLKGIVFSNYKLEYDLIAKEWRIDISDKDTIDSFGKICNSILHKEREYNITDKHVAERKVSNTINRINTYLNSDNKSDEFYVGHFSEHLFDLFRFKSIQVDRSVQHLLTDLDLSIKKISDVLDIGQLAKEQSLITNPDLKQVWVFSSDPLEFRSIGKAHHLKEQYDELKKTVIQNLTKNVKYVYFVKEDFDTDTLGLLVDDNISLLKNVEVVKCDYKNFLGTFTLHFEYENAGPYEIYVSLYDHRDDLLIKIPGDEQINEIYQNINKIRGISQVTETYKVFDRVNH